MLKATAPVFVPAGLPTCWHGPAALGKSSEAFSRELEFEHIFGTTEEEAAPLEKAPSVRVGADTKETWDSAQKKHPVKFHLLATAECNTERVQHRRWS